MIPEIERKEILFELMSKYEPTSIANFGAYPILPVYHKYELLGYVQSVTEEIYRRGSFLSIGCDIFAKRYFDGEIDMSFKEKYENAVELLATLEGFKIDKNKFWYLILFIKDFVEGLVSGGVIENSPVEDLQEIATLLQNNDEKKQTIQIGKNKFNNPATLEALSICINQQLEKLNENEKYRQSKASISEDHSRRNVGIKQYYFTKYMELFLSQFEADEEKVFATINGIKTPIETYDKRILISRIIYIINFTQKQNDITFYEIRRKKSKSKDRKGEIIDKLKGCLREYDKNPPKMRNMNMRYLDCVKL